MRLLSSLLILSIGARCSRMMVRLLTVILAHAGCHTVIKVMLKFRVFSIIRSVEFFEELRKKVDRAILRYSLDLLKNFVIPENREILFFISSLRNIIVQLDCDRRPSVHTFTIPSNIRGFAFFFIFGSGTTVIRYIMMAGGHPGGIANCPLQIFSCVRLCHPFSN